MILQDEFKSNGYLNLLDSANIIDDEINLEDLFDIDDKPVELLGIYISQNRDELFFVLDGNIMDINELCDTWDDRIRVFAIINGKNTDIHRLKYNIVQLIICSDDNPDKNREGNLLVSRKIILKGNMSDAEPDRWYCTWVCMAAVIKWYSGTFPENTYIFFKIWFLGIGYPDALAAGWIHDDHLHLRNPEYSWRADRGSTD